MDDNIFQRACLIQLQTSCWTGSKNLNQRLVKEISDNDWLRAKKILVNPEYLAPIKLTIHKARQHLHNQALSFPLTGLNLVPKDSVTDIDCALKKCRNKFWHKVEDFMANYQGAREEARQILGDLFNEADYPINIRDRFRFEWRFFTLDVPDRASILSPELYEREKQKFLSMMEETRDLAVAALREDFGELVSHLVDRLGGDEDGKPKVFRDSMVVKMNEFLGAFQKRNFFDDDRLAELVEEARSIVSGVSPSDLRSDQGLRESIARDMSRLKSQVDEAIEELPRRRIRMAEAA
ncbi:MAG: hypothetical protein KJ621_18970 [Proteobacteria bacterium]|nr:hypothetical protein [Pseudomonadota bacterium]